ncbi:Reticulocyte-binding protein 2 homolog a [Eumeta japonica]|uniref:Reticulocyte-binding protein 2 homolog a n=1 Tax=Eumeta variegata TaxID=151549 RepID=A0A4C1VTF9_EUMVA|nr:Reticulocyte-binding protein 2 homolog a [Eumeta japonica]
MRTSLRASSTSNVMFASAPLTRRASALQLDSSDNDTKDEADRPPPVMWSSVARRRTDLVPTIPAPRPGRAHSMTRLDRLPTTERRLHSASPSMHHLNRTRHGETTPGSRPGSAMSTAGSAAAAGAVVRRAASTPRRPRPASIAGTGVNTPRGQCDPNGGGGAGDASIATTPSVSRDGTTTNISGTIPAGAGGDVPRRPPAAPAARRPRPLSLHSPHLSPVVKTPGETKTPAEGKPPLHRKPKVSKEHEKTPRSTKAVSPTPTPSPAGSKQPSVDKDLTKSTPLSTSKDSNQVNASEVTQKLEALQIQDHDNERYVENQSVETKKTEVVEQVMHSEGTMVVVSTSENVDIITQPAIEQIDTIKAIEEPKTETVEHKMEIIKPVEEKIEIKSIEKKEERKEMNGQEKTDESEMTASMTARRITTEEEAKAALAERRRRAREELERQAELERQRLQREAEEEAERQRLEEEQMRREEEEARELARLQRELEEEKLRKAIELQQQLEREEAERKAREEVERQARLKEEEEKRKALEEAERLRKEELEREEKERLARRQRVEAIMSRTRLRKGEEDKKQQDKNHNQNAEQNIETQPTTNSGQPTADLLGLQGDQNQQVAQPSDNQSQPVERPLEQPAVEPVESIQQDTATNNGNVHTEDLLGLSLETHAKEKQQDVLNNTHQIIDNAKPLEPQTNNGNLSTNIVTMTDPLGVGLMTANFIQTERVEEMNQKPKMAGEEFVTHNGHEHTHPLTLQNAI